MHTVSRRWSKDEIAVLLSSAPPGVREFLRGLHMRGEASITELSLPPSVVQQALTLFRQRHKIPLFEEVSPPGERPTRYTLRSDFRSVIGDLFRILPISPGGPHLARTRETAKSRAGAALSTFSFRFESPAEAAQLIGLASFLNDRIPTGLSFSVTGNGRDFQLEVR